MKKFFLLVAIVLIGCTHNMQITNLDTYYSPPSPPLKEPVKMGITSGSNINRQNNRYVEAIVESLQKSGSFEKVIYPYDMTVHAGKVEIVTDITVTPDYSGRVSNFFVNWPGFLIFAPAIWGYGYNADIETKVNITHLKDNNSKQISIPTNYAFRQAEMDRTWTEIGWLEWGVIPLIGGFVFTSYDSDVTDEFITKVSPSYGTYVTKKILEGL